MLLFLLKARVVGPRELTLKTLHIGIDDTDSVRKGCTTYVAALLVEKLERLGARFCDYPNLVRLNPNVPWKTRGNGALCLRIRCSEQDAERMKEAAVATVEEQADMDSQGTDPGVVFFEKETVPEEIRAYAVNAITGLVTLPTALKLVKKYEGEAVGFKKGRGIIGSLAAVGETLEWDHTFEVLAYRNPENYGLKRQVDEESILDMDRKTVPYTFNNVDEERGRIIITPRGPDPILFGIRGETAEVVKSAFGMVKVFEPIERWVIFRSNQGTDAHLAGINGLDETPAYGSIIAKCTVSSAPRIIPTRHVVFEARDEKNKVDCAAFEPTGRLRRAAAELIPGDQLEIYGAVRKTRASEHVTINLEKFKLTEVADKILYKNPTCPKCRKRLKSMGKEQGLRCEKCGFRLQTKRREAIVLDRQVRKGLYVTSTGSQRHLTKPLRRYGMEKRQGQIGKMLETWHSA